jgi:anthranilate synthase component 1
MSREAAYNLSGDAFERAARRGTVIPLVREVAADLVTPVGAFLALASSSRRSFLLESAEGGETTGRWSFLGWDPVMTLRAGDGWAERVDAGGTERLDASAPFDLLRDALEPYRPADVPGVPPFAGGLVGYLAYDAARWLERLPPGRAADPAAPWYEFSMFESVVVLDHLKHRVLVVANVVPERGSLEGELRDARERIESVAAALMDPALVGPVGAGARVDREETRSLTPRDKFLDGVRALREEIRAGEIFQAVLSQRFVRKLSASPFSVYRALRRINPSPYLFFVDADGVALAGSSPETLVRCSGGRVTTHPIAGTRARGRTDREDTALERELRGDPKENAEHLMLVDLGRNDLGRVATPGSVTVDRFAAVERYSHVMHLVSRVSAELAPGRDALDALMAAFPAGTVTGAPKVRAMELLNELEPVPRGPYGGAVAYLDLAGNLDSCIAIRTLVAREGRAEVQAGAGIVADSSPEREYDETVSKAEAVLSALSWAEEVLG